MNSCSLSSLCRCCRCCFLFFLLSSSLIIYFLVILISFENPTKSYFWVNEWLADIDDVDAELSETIIKEWETCAERTKKETHWDIWESRSITRVHSARAHVCLCVASSRDRNIWTKNTFFLSVSQANDSAGYERDKEKRHYFYSITSASCFACISIFNSSFWLVVDLTYIRIVSNEYSLSPRSTHSNSNGRWLSINLLLIKLIRKECGGSSPIFEQNATERLIRNENAYIKSWSQIYEKLKMVMALALHSHAHAHKSHIKN